MRGIYVLANDKVVNQLIAAVNSVESNYSPDIGICILPYDDNIAEISRYVSAKENVTVFDDKSSIEKWEGFSRKAWSLNPEAVDIWRRRGIEGIYRLGMHRKLCAFDGPFDEFICMDADILLMRPPDHIFDKLREYDFVVYDFQYKDPTHVYNMRSGKPYELFGKERIEKEIFCAGLFASKKDLFPEERREFLLEALKQGDAEALYAYGPDQTLLNYMVMRSGIKTYNFGYSLPYDKRTGDSVTAPPFKEKDHILYDKGIRLTYLHYIGVPFGVVNDVCAGNNIDFPYRELFLYYRYLAGPGGPPVFKGSKIRYDKKPGFLEKVREKFLGKR